jgi:hypothetical protein
MTMHDACQLVNACVMTCIHEEVVLVVGIWRHDRNTKVGHDVIKLQCQSKRSS